MFAIIQSDVLFFDLHVSQHHGWLPQAESQAQNNTWQDTAPQPHGILMFVGLLKRHQTALEPPLAVTSLLSVVDDLSNEYNRALYV